MNVFVSYASEQERIAEDIKFALVGWGHQVFLARQSLPSGQDYHKPLRKAVLDSDALVFLISPQSIEPGCYTLTELKYAREKWPDPRGRVLPVVIETADDARIPSYLKAVSYLNPEGNAPAEIAAELEKWASARQEERPASGANVPRLEGSYRRRYDDAAFATGASDYISFSVDGRFQEHGFLAAAIGNRILPNGAVVFFSSEAGGEGTFSLGPDTLELNYRSNSYGREHEIGRGSICLSFHRVEQVPDSKLVAAFILNSHTFVRLSTDDQASISPPNGTSRPEPVASEPFQIQEYEAYYHPGYQGFFVQSLGGVVFFTHIPGQSLNGSVRIHDIAPGRWNTFTGGGGQTIPVALWREGTMLRGRWL